MSSQTNSHSSSSSQPRPSASHNDDQESDAKPGDETRTAEQRAENERRVLAAEQARAAITDQALAAKGIEWKEEDFIVADEFEFLPVGIATFNPKKGNLRALRKRKRHDFFSNLSNLPELFMELAKHLRIKDLVSLYAISKDFHEIINGHMSHCMRSCAQYMAPESARLFKFRFYEPLCVNDPAGRPHPLKSGEVRKVPGLRWLQMVVHREKTVRDILACMARQGHRMPRGVSFTLKKIWLLMDVSTTRARVQLMHNRDFITDMDLYNFQLFIVKLDMRFNDPIDGPGDDGMRKLFLGQRGLTPLCKLLKRKAFLSSMDIVRLGIRYAYEVRPEHRGMEIFGVPPEEIGVGHLEGWGAGRVHLMRPDELMMRESVRRQLGLKNHIMEMMLWGYVDPITGKNVPVTAEEKYMSDDEEKPRGGFSDYYDFEGDSDGPKEDLDEADMSEDEEDGNEEEEDDEENENGNYFFGNEAN